MPQTDPKSSSGREQQQTAQTAQNPSPYHQHFEEESIDLYELWIKLWKWKWLVIAITVVTSLGSIVYAMQLKRIYKAEALLLPPKAKDIESINVRGIQTKNRVGRNITGIKANYVFDKFKQNLVSITIFKKFILENGLMATLAPDRNTDTRDEEIYRDFADMFTLGENDGTTTFSMLSHDAENAANWVNSIIEFVDKETINLIVDNKINSITNQIRDVEYTIASKRQMAKRRRQDMITRYQEAALIAQKLGVMDRVDSTNIVQNNQLNITTSNVPLYFRGYRALSTEILSLRSRKSDDPFISGLRDLQEQLALLRSIKFDKENMKAVQIDQSAYPSKYAVKPNRRIIVSLTTVVGLFLGIFLAFFIEFVQSQRKKHLG